MQKCVKVPITPAKARRKENNKKKKKVVTPVGLRRCRKLFASLNDLLIDPWALVHIVYAFYRI